MSAFKDANVMVTGGAGFIGFHLCKEILTLGANVLIYDNLSTGTIKNVKDLPAQRVRFVKGDVRHLEKTENKIENFEIIFHLAAQRDVAHSMANPIEDFEINVLGTLKVLERARKMDAMVIFASTSAVYGNPQKTPTSEDHPIRPISFYGMSKASGEELCRFYYRTYNLPVVLLRIFNAYGPRGHGVIADFLNSLEKNPSKLRILGTGNQSRDFVYISDVVKAFIASAQSKKAVGQVYNVGSGTTLSVKKLADALIELLGLKGVTRIYCTGGDAWEGDLKINHANISRAQRDLQWEARVRLTDGLRTLVREEKFRRF